MNTISGMHILAITGVLGCTRKGERLVMFFVFNFRTASLLRDCILNVNYGIAKE